MFGQNPIRKQELTDGLSLYIEDVWPTLQGEGPFALTPAIFIRTSGCVLKCWYCDTQFEEGMKREPVPISDIEHKIVGMMEKDVTTGLIVLTGGEPLRQNILPLIWRLCGRGYHVQFETAGINWVPGLENWVDPYGYYPQPRKVTIVCSPKTGKVAKEVFDLACAWKYIVSSDMIIDEDGLPSSSTQIQGFKQRLARPPDDFPRQRIYVQPCDEQDATKNASNMALATKLAMRFGYRMSLQSHKTLGVE